MITVRKLLTLARGTRIRKITAILQEAEVLFAAGRTPDARYLGEVLRLVAVDEELPDLLRADAVRAASGPGGDDGEAARRLNAVRHGLLSYLGAEPSDWDLFVPPSDSSSLELRRERRALPFRVYLDDLRSPFNVGSVFRTAESFGVELILLSQATPLPTHPRAARTAMGAASIVPWEVRPLSRLAGEEGVFALELGGTPLPEFRFPEKGIVLLGSEELGVSPEGRRLADSSSGRVSIPMGGLKGSLNVSVAFGILMYEWFVRRGSAEYRRFPPD